MDIETSGITHPLGWGKKFRRAVAKDKWVRFLARFAECGQVTKAAKLAGVSQSAVYAQKNLDEDSLREFNAARDLSTAVLEDVAFERAQDKSDILLMFLLKSRNPTLYDDRVRAAQVGSQDDPDFAAWDNDTEPTQP